MREFPELSLRSKWVESVLSSMTLDQKIGQILHPCIEPSASVDECQKILQDIEPGGMFLFSGTKKEFKDITHWFRERSSVPIIISSDLENGAGRMIEDSTGFPDTMALGAANDKELAYGMGRAAAIEGQACGVHWSFGPVVDINANPYNPITNTTSLGDDPERITRLSKAMIRGMQENGLCSTAKHFPGGGFDDRDQHICNTINPLTMEQWFNLSGRMFQEAIDLGVWSIMVGHISLPSCDPGNGSHVQNSTPATLSRKIVTDLLRKKMGFKGVIITDAMDMAGVTAWGPLEEIIPDAINAGCDMILFASAKRDFAIIKQAYEKGRLTEERIEESVRRILALKEVLGLHKGNSTPPVKEKDIEHFHHISQEIAVKAVTLVRDRDNILPLKLEHNVHVLSYHLRSDVEKNVDTFDDFLVKLGVKVTRFDETDIGKIPEDRDLSQFDIVLMNAVFCPSWGTSCIRPAGKYMRDVWSIISSHHPNIVLISYGSPYLIYEMPHLPCVINAYSPDINTQNAVLNILVGRIPATGTSPVDLERPYQLKSFDLLFK